VGLDLPTDFPRLAVQTFAGAVRAAELGAELTADLRRFCRREGVTPFMLLLAVFDVLLARWSGQEDVLVGSPGAHRAVLALRTDLGDVSSFRELLRHVHDTVLQVCGDQDLAFASFVALVEELLPEESPAESERSPAPSWQVLFAMKAGGPATDRRRLASARPDLALELIDAGAALRMRLEYNAELFAAATACRLLGNFERLLAAAVMAPERNWRELPLLSAAEREQLLSGFNDTGSTSGPELCLHQLFEAQAARLPDRTALAAPDARLTYRELNDRADRLARRLRALGVGPEVLAGVLMDRTADLIVALLAVLKAGGAYVPLDPAYPRHRLLLMLEISRAAVLVTRRALAEDLGGGLPAGIRTLFLDAGWEDGLDEQPGAADSSVPDSPRPPFGRGTEVHRRCASNPRPKGAGENLGHYTAAPLPDQLAYVIFTSGSTGVPKGVATPHRTAVAMTRWARTVYTPEEIAGVLASTSICFDLSVFEIFFTLAAGGKVVLAANALALPDLAAAGEVTLINTVPSAMTELVHQGRIPASVRTVNLAGEALKGSLVQDIHRQLGNVERVVNLYGPTEDTTYSTWSVVPRDAACPAIGRPLTGESAYVLDARLQPVPLGVPGELYLGGEGLTRGYLHRPELTAERYLPNPYGPPGSRLYRVGDRVRYLLSGELDFLGRLDHQVKIRGFRIELGEIEAALTRHREVRQAAVLATSDGHGGNRLIGYLETESDLPPGELRGFLRVSLPDYMVPSGFVPLRRLPLTANGKIDRRALAAMRPHVASMVPPPDRAPASHTEEVLAGIWSEIFGRAVGVSESFFELGGDSLLATRVLARARAALGIELPPSTVLEAVTVAALAERIERIEKIERSEGSEGIEGRERAPSPPLRPPLAPRPRDGAGEPLSLAQRRLWFLERVAPGTAANNIPTVMRLDGPLAPAVLERSLVEIAARHEALRTTIELGPDGEPRQLVAPAARFRLPLADLSGLPQALRLEERERLARAEARRAFGPFSAVGPLSPFGPLGPLGTLGDNASAAAASAAPPPVAPVAAAAAASALGRTPAALWRCLLLRAGEREHDLLVTFHHVIADGESVQVVERELAALYAAFLGGRSSPLPPPPVQPADVAAWERLGLAPEVMAAHLAWFREHLQGAPAGLDLPADRPRPPLRSWRGVSHGVALPPALCRSLRDIARRRGATTYMALFASWAALLRRITGQDDVVVGTVLARRSVPELEGLIGFFATSLPLRIERPGDPSFADLLATVRAGALGLYAHQDLPLEDLVATLRPGRPPSFDPPFQAFFGLHGNAGRRQLAPGLTLEWREEDHGTAPFDLVLDLEDRPEEIAGRLVGSADLFTKATVERLARGWEALVADAAARPAAPVSSLALLGAAERHALLVEWGSPQHPPDRRGSGGSVPERIAAWAAAAPEAVAVLPAEPGLPALTYGELAARAQRLAGQLRARGVGRDARVAVYAERTPETLAGMLAVLAAGGAFLPLDPAHPPERLAAILEDARVPVLLARQALAATLPAGGAELVPLDAAAAGSATPVEPDAWGDIDPRGLAYMIYTSGSTGRPKGVLVPHRGFLWAVEALAERSGLGPRSRVLQFASASFDASVWEIWSALISGATLVLARPEDLLPGPPLLATLRRHRITNVFLTPTALAAMPDGADGALPDLRGLVVGGEAFPPDLAMRWAAGRRLWNAYGPTEASICSTMARLGEDGQTPIGRPVADNRHLVLGPNLELVPRGVPGELYLGGEGLARGYLGKPDLTARAFVPDPFAREAGDAGEAGGRLYRTGDLVRFRLDGQLEFFGRADRQVKVRGFRIEPGEIEAQIAEHPGVREAAVVPYEAGPRDLRLAAYVVVAAAGGAAAPSVHELRAFLRARLPEHMVPSAFRFLAALPLSPSGKIDRRALPLPAADEAEPASVPTSPRTPAEELLAGIWVEVLGRAEVGAGDDFFDLGGHSLLLGRVLARVRAAFGVDLHVRAAFEARTLTALARRVEEALRAQPANLPPRPPLVRASRAEPPPLSFAQQRLWFLDRLEPGSPVYNLAEALRLAGPLDPGVLERSLDEVFRRHESLRTAFAEGPDGEPLQAVAPFHPARLPRIDLAALPPAAARSEAGRQAAREARRPFDLVRGPVARARLLRLGEQEHHLLFCCHHIAFDGWSVGVLRRELGALYGAFAAGQPSPLAELAFQYRDFAAWQRRWLQGEALAAQLAYWRERLAGAPAAVELPADRPRPPVQSFRGATLALACPAGLAGKLRGLARGEGATLFMTALATFSALLARFTGQRDLVVGSPVANRAEAGIEDLLGFFVNTLALRADLTGDPSCRDLLARVRESALAAYAHQDLPFERLVEELQPQRDLSRSPLFQVMFALDPADTGALARISHARPSRGAANGPGSKARDSSRAEAYSKYVEGLEPSATPETGSFPTSLECRDRRQAEPRPAPQQEACEKCGLSPGLHGEPLRVDTGTAMFDLACFLREEEQGGMTVTLEYATDLFDGATVARLGRAYLRLLSGLVETGAESRVFDLPLLGAGERWQILGEWHEPGPPTAVGGCLHDLVAAQIERTPSAVALVAGRERLSYRDLGRRAGSLARRLAALGVGPEVRVAVCLSRSPALVATLLGVLGAGGAYVPLDPSYPRERLGFMLEDADAAVLVTETALASRLPASRARLLVLDAEPAEGAGSADAADAADANGIEGGAGGERPATVEPATLARSLPGNLAYLIYTSGSTGRPKAVAIEHRSAVAFVHWALAAFAAAELEAVLAATSISFDLSVFELFVPLARGGRVVLAANALELPELPAAAEVTLVNTVPSAMAELVRAGTLPAGVRTVNLAGEPLKGSLAQALYRSGVERVRNLFGPSEDTTYSTFELVERGSPREPTIGRPLPGTWVRLLDPDLRPVPVGVPGEIYLGGAGLARGYLGRPDLTADRWVPDPLPLAHVQGVGSGSGSSRRELTHVQGVDGGSGLLAGHEDLPGERLYRTGDLGRWLPDGRLEYLGRLDHQVKVRGFRIELGEIEAALAAHPGVREAVVVALGEPGGNRPLAAYVVPAGQAAPTSGELRDHLRGRLAEFMVPSSVTLLERLPLTPTGKVDRKALPTPAAVAAPAGLAAEPGGRRPPPGQGPRGPVGADDLLIELLAGIWAEVLGREELPGPDDNFFELGGHSLLVTRVVSRVRAALGIELPVRALFAAPTVASLAAVLAAAPAAVLPAVKSAGGSVAPPPPPAPIEPQVDRSGLPLSFAQQRLWLLDRLEPGSAAYNLPLAYRVDGALDAASLERALGEVLRRHEVLRTTIAPPEDAGEPRLVVAAPRRFSLPRVDLGSLPAPARAATAAKLAGEEGARPFDLAAGPLFRAVLLAAGPAEHRLLITMHHIATDGWSLDVLLDEISDLYRAFAAGLPSPLPELPIQYADFAAWQRRWLAGPVLETQLAYWRQQLAGAPEALDLPTDRPRPAVETSHGAQFSAPLSPSLAAAVRAFSRHRGATVFMTLLAGCAAQLHRYTGEADILLGSPVANRNRAEIERLLGFFVNTLVLRANLAGDPSLDTLIARAREMALDAYAHQDLPFERLVEELHPQRSLARSPLFQVQFVFAVAAGERTLAPGLPLSPLAVENRTSKYDLTLAFEVQGDAMVATYEYRTDLFEALTMVRWLGHCETLLAAALARPELPVSALPLLAEPERQALLHEWNDTAAAFPDGLLQDLFERQARVTPGAVALICGVSGASGVSGTSEALGTSLAPGVSGVSGVSGASGVDGTMWLTYAELDAAAERLARSLRRRGVGPEVPVGVCLDRTAELVIALLGVLKAGGAYVPIDPRYPEERRQFLLADSGARVVLTRTALLPLLTGGAGNAGNAGNGAEPLCLDSGEAAGGAGGADPEESIDARRPAGPAAASPRNLAYLIYTSGSTGRPKGVAIEHRSAVALVHWARSVFPPADLGSVLAATSICFDLSVFELFVPLSIGGSVRLVDNALALTPAAGAAGGGCSGLTLINTVPSAMAELVEAKAVPSSVRTVNLAGEPLPRALVDRIYALGTVERVLNLYGPSEDTTYSTWAVIPRHAEPAAGAGAAEDGGAAGPADTAPPPSIGRPVTGTSAYLVDRGLAPVPLGMPGEVVLAGAGLARGYHGRPDLTAERFLPDPFAAEPGGRIYRTGDLARRRRDGEIDFLGRIDHQVKLRGFRIELGEVEATLAAHPAVERAVVATHSYGAEDVRLVAWVVLASPAGGQGIEAEGLRAWMGERLPEFMVPSAVVTLAALPLTPNGKVDRRALPPPAASAGPRAAEAEPPRSPLEELVAGLWAELLGCERVGLHDDFFAAGGHSLLAVRLLARLRDATGMDVPLRALFAHPTVAALTAEVERCLRAQDAPPLPPIEPAAIAGETPASAAQERLWLFHQLDPGGAVLNVPHPLHLSGPLQPAALAGCLAEIAGRHACLRTTFAYGEWGLRQRIAPHGGLGTTRHGGLQITPHGGGQITPHGGRQITPHGDQRIAPHGGATLPLADLGALPPSRRRQEAQRLTEEEARERFDLSSGPLWRARLLRLGEEEHRLLLTFHHTIADGWSVELLDRELAALYPARVSGLPSPLPAPVLQYADYAAWQRRWLTDEVLAPQLAYWRRQLAGMPPALDLPADRPRPPRQSFRGAVRVLSLSPELSAGVKELGRREGSTLFMTAFAAFAAIVGRYAGRTDLAVGSPAANRHQPGTEGLFGFLAGNLVLRLDLGGDPSFRELLRRAREVALGAYAHPDVPFERLVEELDPARNQSRSPLVQVMLLVQAAAAEPLRFAGLAAEAVEVHTATSQFDLTLSVSHGRQDLTLVAEYSTDLFCGSTVERLLAHLSLLLAAVVADPDLRLSALPADVAPRRPPAAAAAPEDAAEKSAAAAALARRQALLSERRARLAAGDKELLAARLRRGK
jgi:amino acid adenylation domain-containing protein